jgi:GxxExxY protein
MPIATCVPIRIFSQEDFGNIAYEVVREAFEVHTALGKMFNESIYRTALRKALGSRAIEEVKICLSHQSFRKEMYLDLLVDLGCPFELKATSCLTDTHQSQLIQYLMLTGLSHGKLINFGTERVEHRFVNCQEAPEQRKKFDTKRLNWFSTDPFRRLEQIVLPLILDWGTGLSKFLYLEAVIALAGGEERCRQCTDTFWQEQRIGQQPVYFIEEGVSIEVSCKKQDLDRYESHLRRLIKNTKLRAILWINITSGEVRLQGIMR